MTIERNFGPGDDDGRAVVSSHRVEGNANFLRHQSALAEVFGPRDRFA
jgi:hypothetical protein